MIQKLRAGPLLAAILMILCPACVSTGIGSGGTKIPPEGRKLIAVWITDVDETVKRATAAWNAKSEKPAEALDVKNLRRELGRLDMQLALNNDGTFILINRGQDAEGTVTVEGSWTYEKGTAVLTGLKEDGQPATPKRTIVYRLEDERLVRASTTPETVHPVLKLGLLP